MDVIHSLVYIIVMTNLFIGLVNKMLLIITYTIPFRPWTQT